MKISLNLFSIYIYVFIVACNTACHSLDNKLKTTDKVKTIIFADSLIKPLLDAELEVFQIHYPESNIEIKYNFENYIINHFFTNDNKIVCMTRAFDNLEIKALEQKKYTPKSLKVAHDAFVCITSNKSSKNSISKRDLKSSLVNKDNSRSFTTITLNRNQSYQTLMRRILNCKEYELKIFGATDSISLFKYLQQNLNSVGLFPLHWVDENYEWVKQNDCKILSIGSADSISMMPDQYHLSSGKYPLQVDIYFNIKSGFTGDGVNFVNFCTGEIGQLVVLKAGLLPINMPTREFYYKK